MTIAIIEVVCSVEQIEEAIAKYNHPIFVRDSEPSVNDHLDVTLEGSLEDLRTFLAGPFYQAQGDYFEMMLVN